MNATTSKAGFAAAFGLPMLLAGMITLPGCQEALPHSNKDAKLPAVTVTYPVQRPVVDYEEFTGRVDAVNKVGVQAMVTGFLDEIKFKDGAEVKVGDVLFEIDPLMFQAAVNKSKASLDQAKARYERLLGDHGRGQRVVDQGAMSIEDFKKIAGDVLEAKAAIEMAAAQLEQDTVNLNYTKVKSKIDGKASRRLIDKGNMVKANETMLTWLYQIDPMYAYFDVDERTVIALRKLINYGTIKSYRDGLIEVDVGLADEKGFSLKGYIDWVDNVLDAGTGTLKIRCVIKQPRDKSGEPQVLISPGMFVRVKLPTSVPHDALLIPENALGTDQGDKFVFVVNEKNEIERRNVTLGQMQIVTFGQTHQKLAVVEKNATGKGKDLQVTDKVVMSGLQRVHAGTVVEPTVVPGPGGVVAPGLLADQNGTASSVKGSD
jgi:RND family efflux transporter MFP subunit